MNLKKIIFSTPDENRLMSEDNFYSGNYLESSVNFLSGAVKTISAYAIGSSGLTSLGGMDRKGSVFFGVYGGIMGLIFYLARDPNSIKSSQEKRYKQLKSKFDFN